MILSPPEIRKQRPLQGPLYSAVTFPSSLAAGEHQGVAGTSPWDSHALLAHHSENFMASSSSLSQAISVPLRFRIANGLVHNPSGGFEHEKRPRRYVASSGLGDELAFYTQAIRQALEAEQLSYARSLLAAIPLNLASTEQVEGLRKVLAPPTVTRTQVHDVDRTQEFMWLKTESHKYRGQWVAIEGDRLVANSHNLRELREILSNLKPTPSVLIHRVV
ncbi:DUF5678 domain-containing protein [Nitrospira defluvii]|uniref:DUF5678 domain-containing protein n=1 Tax=Nitrospira defluvii TaxID=330214 RepID=A0ABM8QLI5_9BACT|nr:hypothetical protein NSPZN2_10848 [Nitrospira defluvii]